MMPCSEQVDCISRKVEVRWKVFFGIKSFMQNSGVHLELMLNGMWADIRLAPKQRLTVEVRILQPEEAKHNSLQNESFIQQVSTEISGYTIKTQIY